MTRLPAAVQRQIDEGEAALAEHLKAVGKPVPLPEPSPAPEPQAAAENEPKPESQPEAAKPEAPPPEVREPEQLELPLEAPPQPRPTDTKSVEGEKPTEDPWQQKYRTLQGKYNSEIAEARRRQQEMEQRLAQQEALVRDMAKRQLELPLPETPQPPSRKEAKRYLTEEEIREYGPDLVDVIGRRAREVAEEMVGDKLRELDEVKAKLGDLSTRVTGFDRVAQSSRVERLHTFLDRHVPEWDQQDKDPLFNQWLQERDGFSGLPRQQLLNDAVGKDDHERVARIFQAYRSEQQAIAPSPNGAAKAPPQVRLDTLAAPARGRAVPRREPDAIKPMTEREIKAFGDDVARGRYRGREAEMRAMEERINAALLAGVIQPS